ncbi:metal ABC transporter substrate-binding protein [Microbulbifer bruguierae]|uniref:High-affinity zinc uptake system protein ZnuA n=1 Tax=Microbulbifer bruguierae TaxID=3029061 RepID=A0ABY8N927_9GAMM|nr:metal ABC transporter substrate-binding protein [Microbulbifer bruguierae]WGL15298.1 metal ABC transporter substrate-binding protein [Microbulbifer bruguierae]
MPSRFCRSLTALFIVCALVLSGCGKAPEPEKRDQPPTDGLTLLASIGPVAMIARAVAGDNVVVRQLIANADPHHYAPKVTDRMAMESAQLVVWMGPEMETVLARQMALVPAARQLRLLQDKTGYEFEGADPADPHLWLRPRNAAVMAAQIASRLVVLDAVNAEGYQQRARDFSRAMANLQKVQDRALWAYKEVPIVTTHQAYSQFFGPAGVQVKSLSGAASHQHGARTMLEQHRRGQAGATRGCLFGEVPANERDRQTAEHLNLGYQALDPLGTRMPANARYPQLMEQLLADARKCLGEIPD